MIPSKKPAVPVASIIVKSSPPARTTPPVAATVPTPPVGGPDPTCIVHRFEEALQLVELMQLTNDQKTKISQLTKTQTEASHVRCTEEKKQHHATHEQILALLTPDQRQKLQGASEASEHCSKGSHAAPVECAVHA